MIVITKLLLEEVKILEQVVISRIISTRLAFKYVREKIAHCTKVEILLLKIDKHHMNPDEVIDRERE